MKKRVLIFLIIFSLTINIGCDINKKNTQILSDKNSQKNVDEFLENDYLKLDTNDYFDRDERKALARLLLDKKWLCENTSFEANKNVRFLALDINQNGKTQLLLSYGDGNEYTIQLISYYNGDYYSRKIDAEYSSFAGYFPEDKMFVIRGTKDGYYWGTGYKFENNMCKEVCSWNDNEAVVNEKICYVINDKEVNREDYLNFINKYNDKNTQFYEINNTNISKKLNIKVNIIESPEEAIDLIKKEDKSYVESLTYDSYSLVDSGKMYSYYNLPEDIKYDLPIDDYYEIEIISNLVDEKPKIYLVGKARGSVYCINNCANCYAYKLKNDKIVEKLIWDDDLTQDWR